MRSVLVCYTESGLSTHWRGGSEPHGRHHPRLEHAHRPITKGHGAEGQFSRPTQELRLASPSPPIPMGPEAHSRVLSRWGHVFNSNPSFEPRNGAELPDIHQAAGPTTRWCTILRRYNQLNLLVPSTPAYWVT